MQAEKRLLVNLLIQEIVLYDDKIEIYFNNPTTIKITIEMYLR